MGPIRISRPARGHAPAPVAGNRLLVRLLSIGAMAHLRSPVKGANRNPAGSCRLASRRRDGKRQVRPPLPGGALFGREGATAGARVGGSRDKKGIANVTTMSSAEPTR